MTTLRETMGSRTAIVLSETLINAVLAFLTYAAIVRITDLATVGLWALVSSVMAFARSVDVWSRGVSAFVAQTRVSLGDGAAATYVSTAGLAGAVGYAAVVMVAAPLLWWGLGLVVEPSKTGLLRHILPWMLVNFWLNSVVTVYQLGFLGFERPLLKALQTVGGSLIFLFGTLLMAPTMGLLGMIYAQIAQGLAMIVFALVVFHRVMMRGVRFRLFDGRVARELFGFGAKATGLGILQLMSEPILRLIANHFGGTQAVGMVDFASRLCQIPRMLIGAIGQTLVPAFARSIHASPEEQSELFAKGRMMIVTLSLSMMSGTIGVAYLAGWLLVEQTNSDTAVITAIITLGWLANLLASSDYFMLYARMRMRLLTLSHVVMTVGMIVLSLAMGAIGGLMGAIAGAMIAVAVAALVVWRASAQHRPTVHQNTAIGLRGVMMLVVTLLLFGGQIFAVWVGGLPTELVAIGGTALTTVCVVTLTPWRGLIRTASSIDRVGHNDARVEISG